VRLLRSTIQQSTYFTGAHSQLLFSQAVRGGGYAGGVEHGGGGYSSGWRAGPSSASSALQRTITPAATATPTATWSDVT